MRIPTITTKDMREYALYDKLGIRHLSLLESYNSSLVSNNHIRVLQTIDARTGATYPYWIIFCLTEAACL